MRARESRKMTNGEPMNIPANASRVALLLAALIAPVLPACHPLDVSNPAIIQEKQLGDTAMVTVMATGIEAQFENTFGYVAHFTAYFADELEDGHVYQPHHPFYRREPDPSNDFVGGTYNDVHALRGTADSLGARMQALLGSKALSSISLAEARVFAGYGFVMLGEDFCGSPINAGPLLTPKQLFDLAITRFKDAIAMANASGASNAAQVANLAAVEAARAALDAGEDAIALSYAQQVPASFQYWVKYSSNSGAQYNDFWQSIQSYTPTPIAIEQRWSGVSPSFSGLHDLRIPQTDSALVLMDTRFFPIPYQPESFSGWKAGADAPFAKDMAILGASGLEAQYIIQEINGPTLAFLNARRAVGGQAPLAALPSDPQAELRDQRRRDFYLTGHRLGDLRRYITRFGVNQFTTGPVPQVIGRVYAAADSAHVCIPISSSERTGNPNLNP